MLSVNIKIDKRCAFCKNWYDPTSSAIRPKFPAQGIWEYDKSVKKMCILRNYAMPSFGFCKKFETKL